MRVKWVLLMLVLATAVSIVINLRILSGHWLWL